MHGERESREIEKNGKTPHPPIHNYFFGVSIIKQYMKMFD